MTKEGGIRENKVRGVFDAVDAVASATTAVAIVAGGWMSNELGKWKKKRRRKRKREERKKDQRYFVIVDVVEMQV